MPAGPGVIGRALATPPPGSVTPSPYPTPPPPPYQTTPPPPPPPTPPAFPASSPAAFSGQWNAPPAGATKKSSTWIPLAAAAAVFVLVLGALGVWWILKKDDSSTTSVASSTSTTRETATTTKSRPPRTTTPTIPNSDSFEAQLFAVLPASYDDGACEAAHPPAPGALATIDCGAANVPTGPQIARYSLFADQGALDQHFSDAIAQNSELVKCPGSDLDSPTAWFYNANPDDLAGQVACGVYEGNQDVTWTKNVDLVLADAQGPNLDELHQWWNDFG